MGLTIVLIGIALGFYVNWILGAAVFVPGVFVGVREDRKKAVKQAEPEKELKQQEEAAVVAPEKEAPGDAQNGG